MEFEDTGSAERPNAINDEMRLNAATRRTVLEPLHTDLETDEGSDARIAADHVLASPIANIPIDSETTIAYTQEQAIAAEKTHHTAFAVSVTATALLTAAVAYLMFAQ